LVRQKQNQPTGWGEELAITDNDIAFLYEWLHAQARPCATKDLALALVEQRLAEQAKAVQAKLSRGDVYQPKKSYEVGQTLVFPALEFATGKIVGIRDGVNPAYPPFKVIQVAMEGEEEIREFAAGLDFPHRLNSDIQALLEGSSPKEIYQEHKAALESAIVSRLSDSAGLGFVQLDGSWFLRELMPDIHIGYLNLAEAMIELNNRPVSSSEILAEIALPAEIRADVQRFSLDLALRTDERFVNLGTPQEPAWYLRRLLPPEVLSVPVWLAYTPIAFDRKSVDPVLRQVENEIDDELSDLSAAPTEKRKPGDKVSLVLTAPHRKAGTLPLTPRTRGFFPDGPGAIVPVRLINGQNGEAMNGWVVPDGGYVFGLREWYVQNEIPAGAMLWLQRTGNPAEIIVDFAPRRMRREWVRVARAEAGKLTFQMTKYPISCEYDEAMLVAEEESQALDELWVAEQERGRPILDILLELFPELAKLGPRVHAKTVYAAFNLMRRCPPGPIFYELSVNPCFVHEGNGYWSLDPAKIQMR